jgi:REP element-mobilizing transposase RayT
MPRRYTPRLATFDYLGCHRYSLTLCTHGRGRMFESGDAVATVLAEIARSSVDEAFAILAYCFMPDHLHPLAQGEAVTSDARRFLSRAKQLSGFSYARTHRRPLWQRSAWDRVLRADAETWTVIRYILANPVRAGLVQHPLDYPYSGSLVYQRSHLIDAFAPAG